MTEVQYPNTTFNIFDGTESTTITPQSVVVGESVYSVSTTLTPTSVVIFDDDPSFAANMTILQDSIVSSENGTTKLIQINQEGFYATDILGNTNAVSGGSLYLTKADGTYINLDLTAGLNINGVFGSAGQVLQKSVPDNGMTWGAPPFAPSADQNLDMASNQITNVSAIVSPAGLTNSINGQVEFDTPPHIPDPILGNDAASKGYVDTLIGNYSGNGLTLYFNYNTTQTNPIIAPSVGDLQQTLVAVIPPTTGNYYTMSSVAAGVGTLISTFTTDVGYPNTLTIPTGLWSMLVWGYTTAQTGQLYYHFHLNEVSSAGVFVAQIGTSGFSGDVNAINSADPDAFHCSLALVAPYTMASVANRLQIQIYTTGTGAVPLNLFTLFGGDYYSNVTTTLNGSTSLLTQNNTWTGVNTFTAGFNTTGIDSDTTLSLGTGTATTTTLGRATQTTNINGATTTITSPTINLSGAVKSNNIDTAAAGLLNIGLATANDVTIGRAGLANARIIATTITFTGNVTGATLVNTGSLTTNSLKSNTTTDGVVQAWLENTGGNINIATATGRAATTNIQNASTVTNSINIGSATTTTTLGGLIRGIGTTLGRSQPVVPTGITYSASGTGAISTSSIGSITLGTGANPAPATGAIAIAAFTQVAEVAVPAVGVYMVNVFLKIRNDGAAGKVDRLIVNLGYGATGTTAATISTYQYSRIPFGNLPAGGTITSLPYSFAYAVTSLTGGFITAALSNTGTEAPNIVSLASTIQIVRIA